MEAVSKREKMDENSSRPLILAVLLSKLMISAIISVALLGSVFGSSSLNSKTSSPQLLEVKIYYEALCPHSKRFIRTHFYDAMINKNLLNYTDIKYVPYGKVALWRDPRTGRQNLLCQHGSDECELNALHACIVENNNKVEQFLMIDCLMAEMTVYKCAKMLNINVDKALMCKSTRSVEDILEKYGKETNSLAPKFIPSITVDGLFDPLQQRSLLMNFKKIFCKQYKQKYNVKLDKC